jgi:DNA-binding NarL/FixJ family response regulator
MCTPLRVAVLSPHQVTRAGLTELLKRRPDRAVVVRPDVVDAEADVWDVAVHHLSHDAVGDEHGVDLRRMASSARPVVAVLSEWTAELAERVLRAGAADVVPISVTAEELLTRIESAVLGRRADPTVIRGRALDAARSATGLTERETEVLERVAAGMTNHQIASELYISINTVKTCIRNAYKRIGARSRSQAVIWALRHGLGTQWTRQPIDERPPVSPL